MSIQLDEDAIAEINRIVEKSAEDMKKRLATFVAKYVKKATKHSEPRASASSSRAKKDDEKPKHKASEKRRHSTSSESSE